MELETIFSNYDTSGTKEISEIDSSRGKSDYRKVYLVTYQSGKRLAIKITNNCFTTPERVRGWSDLIKRYNSVGIYAPKIVLTIDGELCLNVADSLVYAEEFKKYRCADEFVPPVEPREYEEDRYKMIGQIATLPPKLYDWNSPYCLYDVFCEEDETDENYMCAKEWYQLFLEVVPEKGKMIEHIWSTYLKIRTELESEYRKLPKTVFQADLNRSNILLDSDRRFIGIIDFNLAGTETILNYALCECAPPITRKFELNKLMEPEFIAKQDKILKYRLGLVQENYNFTDREKQLYPQLYNMVVPFRWPTFCCFSNAVKHEHEEYLHSIIDWVFYQLTRADLKL